MSALVEGSSLRVRRGGREVLHGLDIQVGRGEIVAVIGPNGAGKSTLLAALAGLVKLSGGSVARRGRLATVLQSPALARRSAVENVELAAKWAGPRRSRAGRRLRALAALRALSIEGLADRPAFTLSGGETRRVHLARGLATDADILLLDEPFAGLDPSTRADLLYDAASALRSPDRATLVVVHDRAEAWALADRVVVLIDGIIRGDGVPADIFDHPPTEQVAAFVGYTGRLDTPGGIVRLRPSDVEISPSGPLEGTVSRLVPMEDGIRVEILTSEGTVVAVSPPPGPPVSHTVRLRLRGGVRYPPASAAAAVTTLSGLQPRARP